MDYAIQLAKKGKGFTSPNPMVGCVIVHNNTIIGQGWHQKAGAPHAEVNAIESVQEKELLKTATLYVTLEPCSHYGRTPPCSSRIIQEGIPKVVVGCVDPNPKVAGSGILVLSAAGCEVITGIREQACKELNAAFFTRQRKQRPYVILKWAASQDGFMAPLQKERETHRVFWLTAAQAQQRAHQLRAAIDVLLVGVQTVIDDDPLLNTRKWYGKSPQIAIIDPNHRIPKNARLLQHPNKVLYFTTQENPHIKGVSQIVLPFQHPVNELLAQLHQKELTTLMVEGGAKTLQYFIDANLWDKCYKFVAPKTLGAGVKAPEIQHPFTLKEVLGPDQLWSASNTD